MKKYELILDLEIKNVGWYNFKIILYIYKCWGKIIEMGNNIIKCIKILIIERQCKELFYFYI
jgi:hypothetical protein